MPINEKYIDDMILRAKITKGESFVINADIIREFLEEFKKVKKENDQLIVESYEISRYLMGDEPFERGKNIPEGELEQRLYWVLWDAFWKNEQEREDLFRIGHLQNFCNKATRLLVKSIKELGGEFDNVEELSEWLMYHEQEDGEG